MNAYTTSQPANERCSVCERRKVVAEIDSETGRWTHWSTCSPECGAANSFRPYCFTPNCASQVCGTPTHLTNGRDVPAGAEPMYACPRCGKAGTRAEWTHASSFASGYTDATRAQQGIDPWLVQTRLRNMVGVHLAAYRSGVNAAVAGDVYDCTTPVLVPDVRENSNA